MCKSKERHSFLASLPKCEHHVHIEGTLMPETLFSLSARNNISLPSDDSAFSSQEALLNRYEEFTSLDDFLHYYYVGFTTLIHERDFEDLAWDYFRRAAGDGVVHAEISFDPQAHMDRGVAFSTVVEGLIKARARAWDEFGMSSELICCFLRHLPVESSVKVIESEEFRAAVTAGKIVGIGLDSSEIGFPPEKFKRIYEIAKGLGVRLTAHAGEEGPASNVRTAVEVLGCQRIDHGIRLMDDPVLLEEIANTDTLLTVCPLSNLKLQCVKSLRELPIRQFLDAGIKFSLNSDDGAYFGGFVQDNFCAVQDAFELSEAEWIGICRAAIAGSWCDSERKQHLYGLLQDRSAA